jgi:uncharacterized membrane protein HdeD (DUF308 family)
MADVARNDYERWLSEVGRAWGWLLAMGIISVVIGLLVIFFPHPTLLVIAMLFGIQLIAIGVFRFVAAFTTPDRSGWLRALSAVLAVLAFIVGIYLLRRPLLSLLVLAVLLGIFWIAHGVIELFAAIGDSGLPARGWVALSGILSIAAGAVVLAFPDLSLLILTLILGIWLVVYGVILGIRAFRVHSAMQNLRAFPRGMPTA